MHLLKTVQTYFDQFSDHRGKVIHQNSLALGEWKRVYFLENSEVFPVRGWHGHSEESKCFIPVFGTFRIEIVGLTGERSKSNEIEVFNLSADKPSSLFVPPQRANRITALQPESRLLVLSSMSLYDSEHDLIRYPLNHW